MEDEFAKLKIAFTEALGNVPDETIEQREKRHKRVIDNAKHVFRTHFRGVYHPDVAPYYLKQCNNIDVSDDELIKEFERIRLQPVIYKIDKENVKEKE